MFAIFGAKKHILSLSCCLHHLAFISIIYLVRFLLAFPLLRTALKQQRAMALTLLRGGRPSIDACGLVAHDSGFSDSERILLRADIVVGVLQAGCLLLLLQLRLNVTIFASTIVVVEAFGVTRCGCCCNFFHQLITPSIQN